MTIELTAAELAMVVYGLRTVVSDYEFFPGEHAKEWALAERLAALLPDDDVTSTGE